MAVFIREDTAEKLSKDVHLPQKLTNLMTKKANYYGEIDPKLKGYKRAKKIASAAEKEEYNTQKGKFKPSESGVTLNYNEIKRWSNALKHLPKNSDAFDANGGEEGKMMVNDLMKQVRRNSHKVEMIPPVEKLVKDTKVSDSKLKPTKLGSSDVYMESIRKVYINESQLRTLKEVYNQLTIPFDGKYHEVNGKQIPLKYDYEYFIDWLEEIGNYGKLNPTSNKDFSYYFNLHWDDPSTRKDIINLAISDYEGNGCCDELINAIGQRLLDLQDYDGERYFSEEFETKEETEEYLNEIMYENDLEELSKVLTPLGVKRYEEILEDYIYSKLTSEGFHYYPISENGLLYIERVIKIPDIVGKSEFDTLLGTDGKTNKIDFFEYYNYVF